MNLPATSTTALAAATALAQTPTAHGLTGSPRAADFGMFISVQANADTGLAAISLDAAGADAVRVIMDNLTCSDLAQQPGAYGHSVADARAMVAVANAIGQPLLKLAGFPGSHRGGQFGADPYAAGLGLSVVVGTDRPTGRVIIVVDVAAAGPLALILEDVIDSDDLGQPDDIATGMRAAASAIVAPLARLIADTKARAARLNS